MGEFFLILLISTLMIFLTGIIFYELLRQVGDLLPRLSIKPRFRVTIVILGIFGGHSIAVWLYAIVFWVIEQLPLLGNLSGSHDGSFESILYFSAATYSSLGYGDIVPAGPVRLLAGIEVLNGLVLIGWSASFTYLVMQKFWDLHKRPTNQ